MLMRGDMEKIIDQVNPVFDTAFARIEALEKKIEALEAKLEKPTPKPKAPPKAA